MKSITRHLCLSQLILQFAVCSVFCVALYLYIQHVLTSEFTRNLDDQSRTLAQLVANSSNRGAQRGRHERMHRDTPELTPESIDLTDFNSSRGATSYFIFNPKGRLMLQSDNASPADIQSIPLHPAAGTSGQVKLPDGRTLGFAQSPVRSRPASEHCTGWTVLVVRNQEQITHTLKLLAQGLAVGGITLLITSAGLSIWSTRNGLAPLKKIAAEVGALDSTQLGHRFESERLPSELTQITNKLNDLLERLEQAFLRERSFAGSAAHELRTPLAELKAIAQVGASWNRSYPDDPTTYFHDAGAIITRMESLLTGLHSLVSSVHDSPQINWTALNLIELVQSCAHPLGEMYPDKTFTLAAPADVHALADHHLLSAILSNLLHNAFEYADPSSPVSCHISLNGQSIELNVSNFCSGLSPSDIEQMTNAFWRKDASRTGTLHQGLGLAIAQTYAQCIGCTLSTRIDEAHLLTVSLSGLESV